MLLSQFAVSTAGTIRRHAVHRKRTEIFENTYFVTNCKKAESHPASARFLQQTIVISISFGAT